MLKKLIILLFVVAPLGVFAQDKIAYVSVQEVFGQMPELKDIESKLATKQEEIKNELAAMDAEYQSKMKKFSEDTSELTETILLDRQQQVQKIQERYQEHYQYSEQLLQKYQQELVAPVQQKLQKAIQKVGADKGVTYVIDSSAILYTSPSALNISDAVKAELGIK